jgi:hypothetical protein
MSRSRRTTKEDGPFFSETLTSSPTLADSSQYCSVPSSPAKDSWPLHRAGSSSHARPESSDTVQHESDSRDPDSKSLIDAHREGRRRFRPQSKGPQEDAEAAGGQRLLPREMDPDAYFLAMTGYNQVLERILRPSDNFFAMLATMSLATSMPAILFLISIYIGGPKAALANWLLAGAFSMVLALCLGEIAVSMPTSAGMYQVT